MSDLRVVDKNEEIKLANTIWKFQLNEEQLQQLEVPSGAQILTANFQDDNLCIWALVNDEAPREPRYIRLIGTGQVVDMFETKIYINTVFKNGFVFHIFEVIK